MKNVFVVIPITINVQNVGISTNGCKTQNLISRWGWP